MNRTPGRRGTASSPADTRLPGPGHLPWRGAAPDEDCSGAGSSYGNRSQPLRSTVAGSLQRRLRFPPLPVEAARRLESNPLLTRRRGVPWGTKSVLVGPNLDQIRSRIGRREALWRGRAGAEGPSIGRIEGLLRGGGVERRGRGGPQTGAARAVRPAGGEAAQPPWGTRRPEPRSHEVRGRGLALWVVAA